jgi:hypothetical protein
VRVSSGTGSRAAGLVVCAPLAQPSSEPCRAPPMMAPEELRTTVATPRQASGRQVVVALV